MTDLINELGSKGTDSLDHRSSDMTRPTPSKEEEKPQSNTEENKNSKEDSSVDTQPDLSSWTKEDLYKSRKKVMQEAAESRFKNKNLKEQLDDQDKEFSDKFQKTQEEYENRIDTLSKKASEYDKFLEQQADSKRSLEEKLAARDKDKAILQRELEKTIKVQKKIEFEYKEELDRKEAEVQAFHSIYNKQIKDLVDSIPEDYRSYARSIANGAEDLAEAVNLLMRAKDDGIFGPKEIHVNHGSPNANTGARLDGRRIEDNRRQNMKPRDKIGQGLQDILSGKQKSIL